MKLILCSFLFFLFSWAIDFLLALFYWSSRCFKTRNLHSWGVRCMNELRKANSTDSNWLSHFLSFTEKNVAKGRYVNGCVYIVVTLIYYLDALQSERVKSIYSLRIIRKSSGSLLYGAYFTVAYTRHNRCTYSYKHTFTRRMCSSMNVLATF